MKLFTKQEWLAVFIILALVAVASFFNFRTSLTRARDAQRISDLQEVVDALVKYNSDFGFFPSSTPDGKIVACKKEGASLYKGMKLKDFLASLAPCEWGKDALTDITDASYPAYLKNLPADPKSSKGFAFHYISDGRLFQLYTALELRDSDQYAPSIVARKIMCGVKICNAGRTYGTTPLDKSLEEYENELLRQQKK